MHTAWARRRARRPRRHALLLRGDVGLVIVHVHALRVDPLFAAQLDKRACTRAFTFLLLRIEAGIVGGQGLLGGGHRLLCGMCNGRGERAEEKDKEKAVHCHYVVHGE